MTDAAPKAGGYELLEILLELRDVAYQVACHTLNGQEPVEDLTVVLKDKLPEEPQPPQVPDAPEQQPQPSPEAPSEEHPGPEVF